MKYVLAIIVLLQIITITVIISNQTSFSDKVLAAGIRRSNLDVSIASRRAKAYASVSEDDSVARH